MKIAIIGAGLAGTQLYKNLKKDKHQVTLFEKSRGAGGRCSTRYIEDKVFDHGTPYFKATSELFKNYCDKQTLKKILVKKDDYYFPIKGMNQLCSVDIIEDDFKRNTKIVSCKNQDNYWILKDENNVYYRDFDKLIITIPAPQVLELDIDMSLYIKKLLLSVEYDSVATLIMYSKTVEEINISDILNHKLFKNTVNNSLKYGYEDFDSYILHINQKLINTKEITNKMEIIEFICNEVFKISNIHLENYFYLIPHFWKYALVSNGIGKDFLYDDTTSLGFAGDYFSEKNLEGAYLSADQLYEQKFR